MMPNTFFLSCDRIEAVQGGGEEEGNGNKAEKRSGIMKNGTEEKKKT